MTASPTATTPEAHLPAAATAEPTGLKIVQINTVANSGSTGRVAEGIGRQAIAAGNSSFMAYGRRANPSHSQLIRVGNRWDLLQHVVRTRLLDQHGRASTGATQAFIRELEQIGPDVVHLHNIHGYYLDYQVLFDYLSRHDLPVVWTLHDCWPFTGHCAYFDSVDCHKWKTGCSRCPLIGDYPSSVYDASRQNYALKQATFNRPRRMVMVTPCQWLADLCRQSFLGNYPVQVIPYGVDLQTFHPSQPRSEQPLVLGVAKPWTARKGLHDFIKLRSRLPDAVKMVLIGVSPRQRQRLPPGIEGVMATESTAELAAWYSRAWVLVNPTYSDNFPVVNLEALACGTPVVTYATGGSPEAVAAGCGAVVPKGDNAALAHAIRLQLDESGGMATHTARQRAETLYCDRKNSFRYLELYRGLLDHTVTQSTGSPVTAANGV